MSSEIKPIKVWGNHGPNPPKVAILLSELGLPSEVIDIPFSDVKKPDYLAINPNGRLPAIHDPNTDITLWESGAIIEYLIDRYDKEHRLSFAPDTPESYYAKQWLFFQTTGQGPYFGQVIWFKKFHPEKVPSAEKRYLKEVDRVTGVLDGWLAQQEEKYGGSSSSSSSSDGPWLVGNKYSYADLAFIPWQKMMAILVTKEEFDLDNFPHVKVWLDKMLAREKVKAVFNP